jgi:hypothetical protein
MAHPARVLGAMDEAAFERKVAEARDGVLRSEGASARCELPHTAISN